MVANHSELAQSQTDSSLAVVLGGGGSTGNAWLIGVVAGLYDEGIDVTRADLTVGTSAGSTAAAQLAGSTSGELYSEIVDAPAQAPTGTGSGGMQARPVVDHLARMRGIIASSADAADLRRKLGAASIELDAGSDGSWQTQWRATVASRFSIHDWPKRSVLITAIDADLGEQVVFDKTSGVDLVDAVAASCSSRVPYVIGTHRYLDGGFRSNADNADLAAGHARVLVLSPLSGQSLTPLDWGMHLATQVDALRSSGSDVTTIFPTSNAEYMFGANAMDLSLRPLAARAGFEQAKSLAGELGTFWS